MSSTLKSLFDEFSHKDINSKTSTKRCFEIINSKLIAISKYLKDNEDELYVIADEIRRLKFTKLVNYIYDYMMSDHEIRSTSHDFAIYALRRDRHEICSAVVNWSMTEAEIKDEIRGLPRFTFPIDEIRFDFHLRVNELMHQYLRIPDEFKNIHNIIHSLFTPIPCSNSDDNSYHLHPNSLNISPEEIVAIRRYTKGENIIIGLEEYENSDWDFGSYNEFLRKNGIEFKLNHKGFINIISEEPFIDVDEIDVYADIVKIRNVEKDNTSIHPIHENFRRELELYNIYSHLSDLSSEEARLNSRVQELQSTKSKLLEEIGQLKLKKSNLEQSILERTCELDELDQRRRDIALAASIEVEIQNHSRDLEEIREFNQRACFVEYYNKRFEEVLQYKIAYDHFEEIAIRLDELESKYKSKEDELESKYKSKEEGLESKYQTRLSELETRELKCTEVEQRQERYRRRISEYPNIQRELEKYKDLVLSKDKELTKLKNALEVMKSMFSSE